MIQNIEELIAALNGEIETHDMERRIHAVVEKYYESSMFDYNEHMRPIRLLHPKRSIIRNPDVKTFSILRELKQKQENLTLHLKELALQKGMIIRMPSNHENAVHLSFGYIRDYMNDSKTGNKQVLNRGIQRIANYFSVKYSCEVTSEDLLKCLEETVEE